MSPCSTTTIKCEKVMDKKQKQITIQKDLENEIIKELNDDSLELLFKGERADDITKEALLISLKTTLDLARMVYKKNMR